MRVEPHDLDARGRRRPHVAGEAAIGLREQVPEVRRRLGIAPLLGEGELTDGGQRDGGQRDGEKPQFPELCSRRA